MRNYAERQAYNEEMKGRMKKSYETTMKSIYHDKPLPVFHQGGGYGFGKDMIVQSISLRI